MAYKGPKMAKRGPERHRSGRKVPLMASHWAADTILGDLKRRFEAPEQRICRDLEPFVLKNGERFPIQQLLERKRPKMAHASRFWPFLGAPRAIF